MFTLLLIIKNKSLSQHFRLTGFTTTLAFAKQHRYFDPYAPKFDAKYIIVFMSRNPQLSQQEAQRTFSQTQKADPLFQGKLRLTITRAQTRYSFASRKSKISSPLGARFYRPFQIPHQRFLYTMVPRSLNNPPKASRGLSEAIKGRFVSL